MMTRQTRSLVLSFISVLFLVGCGGSEPSQLETGGINANDMITNLMDRTSRIMSDVTSVPTAEAALPELEKVNEDYDRLIKESDRLSQGARADLAQQASRYMPGLKDMARRVGSWKGVSDVLGPTMNEIVGKMAQLR